MAVYETVTAFRLSWPREAAMEFNKAIDTINDIMYEGAVLFEYNFHPVVRNIIDKIAELGVPPGVEFVREYEGYFYYKDDSGMFSPSMTADLMQAVATAYGISTPTIVTYAETCTKHRVGAFSGGGFVVAQNFLEEINATEFLNKIVADFKAKPSERDELSYPMR
ncbi:MAG: hypothetical protein QW299_09520 [Candidatus Caldarchaeum sp.]